MTKALFNDDFTVDITVALDDGDDPDAINRSVRKKLGLTHELPPLEIKRRSIDARRGKVSIVYTLGLVDNERDARIADVPKKLVEGEPVIIIGAGPAGLFCAYELARRGIPAVICERGKMVQERRKDLKGLNQHGVVDNDSNYCFGEGGAGTYSDGKLYTRSHKRGSVRDVLEILVAHGAQRNILTEGRPHIGSNKLPKVITAIRNTLENIGVNILFNAKVVDILVENGRARGVVTACGKEIEGRAVVVASGHSAHDVVEMLERHGVAMEQKPFAMGVRIEHPQPLINKIQYGKFVGHKLLPPAYYRLAYTPSDGRGAFSFCMCPGGWIVPAATSSEGLVVNGMSLSKRDSPFANSGLVVAISVEDVKRQGKSSALSGITLQKNLERKAMIAGGGKLVAPAVRVNDFLNKRISKDLPPTSYLPGITPADLHDVLDVGVPIAPRIRDALGHFDSVMPGIITNDAILVGVESRTSSPVRIIRDASSLQSSIAQLFPCGEGAGFAGGIISAAIDGINVADRISGL